MIQSVVARVIVIRDHKILIGRRSQKKSFSGKYCLPGGKVEVGEYCVDAAKRELFEETGIKISELTFFTAQDIIENDKQYIIFFYMGYVPNQTEATNREPEKNDEWIWIDKTAQLDFMSNLKFVLRKL